MRSGLFAVLAAASLAGSAPALADQHRAPGAELGAVLEHERRAEDRPRDQYRHPAETLAFFRIEPGMTVAEYAPGGGWYTRVLAPYIAEKGRYIAIDADSDALRFNDAAAEARARAWPQGFPARVAEWTGLEPSRIAAYESDEVPEDLRGKIDRVLIFRSLHGMIGGNRADSELRNLRQVLADDGLVGVVQHRAAADAPYSFSSGGKGYLREADVIKLFELNGFELVEKSEINANPNDPANWEGGVWTLPPNYRGAPESDAARRAELDAIGESDRMTLLFKKRA